MKTERNILFAFILNLAFSILECVGGILTGSVSILSDSVHDFGDSVSIGLSFFFEKKSRRAPDKKYTYGYARFSLLGGVIATFTLLLGSFVVLYNAIQRIIHPTQVHYNGMLLFAVIGVSVNFLAAYITRKGDSLNQKSVNLHMLEDVLGWLVVLLGAAVMKFTDATILDPILSIGISFFIFIHACKHLKSAADIFLEKAPQHIDVNALYAELETTQGVLDVHHLHVWSLDGRRHYATLHVVSDDSPHKIKDELRTKLSAHGIVHATFEFESSQDACSQPTCLIEASPSLPSACACHCAHHHE